MKALHLINAGPETARNSPTGTPMPAQVKELLREAADVIEELSKHCAHYQLDRSWSTWKRIKRALKENP